MATETRVTDSNGHVMESPELWADWDQAVAVLRDRGIPHATENWRIRVDGRWFTATEALDYLNAQETADR